MDDADSILGSIVDWARQDENVRGLVLVGSRANGVGVDRLADVDLQIYANLIDRYTSDDRWLSRFGDVWVCVHDEYRQGDLIVPTRLTIFDPGAKFDFSFYPAQMHPVAAREGTQHRVLLDKDSVLAEALAPIPGRVLLPDQRAFARVVEEFWFETYHVAKYLVRDDLWLAKARDWACKEFLLTMLEWHLQASSPDVRDGLYPGKSLRSRVTIDMWDSLRRTFGGFEQRESWTALHATMELFRRLATDTATRLGLDYANKAEEKISSFVAELEREATGAQHGTAG
jgi:aminoglycoside 6-adenylyltransferase